jgi:Mce-associated membrane protein
VTAPHPAGPAAEAGTAGSSAASAASAAAAPRRRRLLVALCAAGLLLLLALVLLTVQLLRYESVEDRREAALRAAKQSALNLTSIDNESFDEDVQAVLEGSTGAFRSDFEARSKELEQVLTENQVVSEGKVIEAGLVRSDSRHATVLVVVDSTVRNTAVPEGRVNTYRMQLELELRDGRWRTSMLEFVG